MTLPSYQDILPYIDKKLVSEQSHPEDPAVRIFNYTQECQHSGAWDDVTRQCRGLILNVETGQVLANPFPKFFNYQEHIAHDWPIPDERPIITEKYDGSLGILYHIGKIPWIATRGSFMSDQARWATEWYRKAVHPDFWLTNSTTHLFEIVFKANRIVVNYDFEGLVYIASRITETGRHVDAADLWMRPFRRARHVPPTDLAVLASADSPTGEGFVCHYPDANVRLKVKFPEYVRLHKILTGLSEIGIWEHLREGKKLDLERIPDEFMSWVDDVQDRLRASYGGIEDQAKREYAVSTLQAGPNASRKDLALLFQRQKLTSLLFAMLDGKDYSDAIWRMSRPSGARQFTTDHDT